MNFKSLQLFVYLGTCLNCGSFRNTELGLCEICAEEIVFKRMSEKTSFTDKNLKIRSLCEWTPGESDELSSWILQLKKSPAIKWNHLAEMFVQQHIREIMGYNKTVFIPCPSRHKDRTHSQLWTQAIGKLLPGQILEPLSFEKSEFSQTQKAKSKLQRQKINFKIDEIFTQEMQLNRFERIVFLDDVVTTGSTAWAAYLALGRPSHFEVWCIGYRLSLRVT